MSNAIGLFTKVASWTNPNFDFIAGWAGRLLATNDQLKPIQTQAEAEGLPFFLWYEFSTDIYSHNQIDAGRWPTPENDVPLQKLIIALTNRKYAAVVIQVEGIEKFRNVYGEPEDQAYISHACQVFIGRVRDWLNNHGRAGVKVIAASSDDFISQYAQPMNNWIGTYDSCAVQPAVKPLVDSLPDPLEKPSYLDNRTTCEFWRYRELNANLALVTYRMGGRAALYTWLGFDASGPVPQPIVSKKWRVRRDLAAAGAYIRTGPSRLAVVAGFLTKSSSPIIAVNYVFGDTYNWIQHEVGGIPVYTAMDNIMEVIE